MSDLMLKIQDDLTSAMKNKDELVLSVLRMLKSAVQLAQVEKGKENPLTDDEVLVLVRRLIKQRNEAASMYRAGGAEDRAVRELEEAKVLERYQPAQLSDEEIEKIISDAAVQVGAAGPKDMGKVMQALNASHKGRFDGKTASEAVKAALQALG